MQKRELAKQLLRSIHRDDIDPSSMKDATPDEVIAAYISCSCCGELMIPRTAIEPYVLYSANAEDFMELVQETVAEISGAFEAPDEVEEIEEQQEMAGPTKH